MIDGNGTVLYTSPSTERVTGYTPDDFVGRNAFDQIHPDDLVATQTIFADLLAHPGKTASAEFRFRHKDGSWRWMEGIGRNLLADSEVGAIVSSYRDITARKRLEQRLSTQFSLTRVLVESSSLSEVAPRLLEVISKLGDWQLGELWHVTEQNDDMELEGRWMDPSLDSKGLIERSPVKILRRGIGFPGKILMEGGPLWTANISKEPWFVRTTMAAAVGLHAAVGFPIWSRDCVTGVMAFYKKAVAEPDNQLLGMFELLGIQIGDFIEHKRVELAMVESEQRYHAFFNLATIGAAQCDTRNQRFLDVNRKFCEITGYTRDELLQMVFPQLVHPDERSRDLEGFSKLWRGTLDSYETERRYIRKDGRIIWVRIAATIVKSPSGTPLHMAAVIMDVTDRRMAEKEREKLIAELRKALAEVKTLSGLLPICAWCKKVRDDRGYWELIESYFATHSDLQFTHGICPECIEKYHPQVAKGVQSG